MARRDPSTGRKRRGLRGLDLAGLAVAVLGGLLLITSMPPAVEGSGRASGRGHRGAPPSAEATSVGYETEDMSGGDMALIALGLAVCVALAIGAIFLMLHWFHAADRAGPPLTAEQRAQIVPPAPHLQVHPHADLRAERAREEQLLHAYVWLDAGHSMARIPIDRAIALTVGQSLDAGP